LLQMLASWCRTQRIKYQVDLVPCGCPHPKRHTSNAEKGAESGPPRSINACTLIGEQQSDCDVKLLRLRARRRRLPYKRRPFPVCTGVVWGRGDLRSVRQATAPRRAANSSDVCSRTSQRDTTAEQSSPGAHHTWRSGV
jgi:hypothetical protein